MTAPDLLRSDDIRRLRAMMGGSGEIIPLHLLEQLWEEYSESMDAGWMLITEATVGDFCGWLAHMYLWSQGKRARE